MIMNKKERPSFFKGKGAAVGIVICFVAVIAIAGTYTFNNYQKQLDDQMAKAEEQAEELTEENSAETTTDDILLPEDENPVDDGENTNTLEIDDKSTGEADTGKEDEQNTDSGTENAESSDQADPVAESGSSSTSDVWFSEDSTLTWPASGAVLIGYSMDQTVFFSTLEQYKYNPALIIGGEVGETIAASAAGIVTDIETTAQTGVTVTMDLGNGYSAVYGQLDNVPLEIGDYVGAGETVGTLSEPTKYYSVEGPNLYFQILKDGEPENPMNFME